MPGVGDPRLTQLYWTDPHEQTEKDLRKAKQNVCSQKQENKNGESQATAQTYKTSYMSTEGH